MLKVVEHTAWHTRDLRTTVSTGAEGQEGKGRASYNTAAAGTLRQL